MSLLEQIPFVGPAGKALGLGAHDWEQLIKTGSFKGEEEHKKSQLGNHATIVQEAANKYHLPGQLLWGIFGIETSHGADIKTSSTGAMGAFQFEPATAKEYNYPLTNTPNEQQFKEQAEAAAHYLSDSIGGLKTARTPANLEKAVKIYNSGSPTKGYTLKEVLAHAGSMANIFSTEAEGYSEQAKLESEGGSTNPLEGIEQFFEALAQTSTWVRIGKGVAGLILIYMGLREFTKMGPSGGDVALAPLGAPGRVVAHHRAKAAKAADAAADQARTTAAATEAASRQAARAKAASRGPAQHHHVHLHEAPKAAPKANPSKPKAKPHGKPKGR